MTHTDNMENDDAKQFIRPASPGHFRGMTALRRRRLGATRVRPHRSYPTSSPSRRR